MASVTKHVNSTSLDLAVLRLIQKQDTLPHAVSLCTTVITLHLLFAHIFVAFLNILKRCVPCGFKRASLAVNHKSTKIVLFYQNDFLSVEYS